MSACLRDLDLDRLTFEAGIKVFFVLTVVIYRYQLLYIVIRCYLLLFVVIRCYLLLSVVICCYPLIFVVICCYLLLSVVICCYLDNDKYRSPSAFDSLTTKSTEKEIQQSASALCP